MDTNNLVLVGLLLLVVAAMLILHLRRYGRCSLCKHVGELWYHPSNPDDGVCVYCLAELVDGFRAERKEMLKR